MKKITLLAGIIFLLAYGISTSATDYDAFVDVNNTSGIEDGTEANPFNSINEAIELVKNNDSDHRKIFVKNGEYLETIVLEDEMELYGESKSDTIINGEDHSDTVIMNNKTVLKNIKIYKGDRGISVEENSKATISKVKIQKTKKIGINIKESTKKRLVTIEDCEIYKGRGKGIYMQKDNYARIYDNEIYENDEEGIDVRSSAKGSIKSNKIYKNDEGGIEIIVERSKMDIDKNKIYKNSASGIALQAYKGGLSSVSNNAIEKNKITSNKQYGIECNTPSDLKTNKSVLWSESATLRDNTITGNKKGILEGICHFVKY